jgi:hypothetical protein
MTDAHWEPMSIMQTEAIRGDFSPSKVFRFKRWVGLVFFFILLPIFGCIYINHIITKKAFTSTSVDIFMILISFLSPFIFGKMLWKIKPFTYSLNDEGVATEAGLLFAWEDLRSIHLWRMGNYARLKFVTENSTHEMPVYSSLMAKLPKTMN